MRRIRQAAVLCGGLGTRLLPITKDIPKPLVKVGTKPMLEIVLSKLQRSGITQAILLTGYKSEMIEEHFGSGEDFGIEIKYSVETGPLGSAGALLQAKHLLDDDFFVCNCDTITDYDFRHLFSKHISRDALVTMLFAHVEEVERFGIAELAPDGKILRFLEKPKRGETASSLASLQMFALDNRVFSHIKDGMFSMEREVFPKLCSEGKMYGETLPKNVPWLDVGTLADLEKVEAEVKKGKHAWLFD